MRTSTFPLTDRLLDGNLAQLLTEWRAANDSFEVIARRLESDHDIVIGTSTVRRWCHELGIPSPSSSPTATEGART